MHNRAYTQILKKVEKSEKELRTIRRIVEGLIKTESKVSEKNK